MARWFRFSRGVAFLALMGWSLPWARDAQALGPRKLVSQYTAHEWSTEDGLPDNDVQAIVQGRDGHLWLGTQKNGVVRFDGVRFTEWPPDALSRDREVSIRSLLASRSGSLWVGTDRAGVWQIQGQELTRHTVRSGLPNDRVQALHEDRNGVLWIAFEGKALVQWQAGRFMPMPLPENGPVSVVAFHEDKEGGMWLAGDGLWYFKDGQCTNVRQKLGLTQERFTSVCEDRDGSVWVATLRGLLRFRRTQLVTYLEVDGLSDDQVTALHLDRDGNLWIGTNSGLDRFRDGQFTRCVTRERAPYDLVHRICEDREGSLWIGTSSGLTRLRDDKFSNLTTRDGLLQNLIAAAVEAPDGSLWVATWTRGVARLKGGEITYDTEQLTLRVQDDGTGFDVSSTMRDNDGRYGLLGMRERAEKLGGELTISSESGRGTMIEVVVPQGRALKNR
jgi:ligand-binding sensor domain-containing protein